MSHKSTINMKIDDRATLISTLKMMGISFSEAEKTNGLKTECSYQHTISDVDIRMENDSHGNDMKSVGFRKEDDDTYTAVGDFWSCRSARTKEGESINEATFKDAVSKRYVYLRAVEQLQNSGFSVENPDSLDFTQNEVKFSMESQF